MSENYQQRMFVNIEDWEEGEMIIFEKIAHSETNPFDNTDVRMTIHFKELPNLDELLDTVKDFLVACGYGIERIEAYYPGDNLVTTSKTEND